MKCAINGATTMPYSLEMDIKAAEQTGLNSVELWWDKVKDYLKAHDLEELRQMLDDSDMNPIGLCPFLVSPFRNSQKLRKEFEEAVKVAKAIGCHLLTVCPDFRPVSMSVEEGLRHHGKEFAWYARQAEKSDICLAIEPIGCHTLVPGPMEALKVIELAGSPPNLGIVMDTFHYTRTGVTMDAIKSIPLERLFIVHINDSEEGMAEELSDANRLYPYEGALNLEGYERALQEIGYEGYCSVEVFRPQYWEADIMEIMKKSLESATKFISKAGGK